MPGELLPAFRATLTWFLSSAYCIEEDEFDFTWKIIVLATALKIQRLQALVWTGFDRICASKRSTWCRTINAPPVGDDITRALQSYRNEDEKLRMALAQHVTKLLFEIPLFEGPDEQLHREQALMGLGRIADYSLRT